MDPDYLDETLIRMRAEGDFEAAQERKRKRRGKGARRGVGSDIVDADLSEIE